MLRPMILLTFSVAIPDEHTRLTRLQTDSPLLAALGTAVGHRKMLMVHSLRGLKFGGGGVFYYKQIPNQNSLTTSS